MRERVEDLGRLMVMIDNVLDMKLFDKLEASRIEDIGTDITIQRWMIQTVQDELYNCLEICKGFDYLNQEEDS